MEMICDRVERCIHFAEWGHCFRHSGSGCKRALPCPHGGNCVPVEVPVGKGPVTSPFKDDTGPVPEAKEPELRPENPYPTDAQDVQYQLFDRMRHEIFEQGVTATAALYQPEMQKLIEMHNQEMQGVANKIFRELDKAIIPFEGFGRIIPASEKSAYEALKKQFKV